MSDHLYQPGDFDKRMDCTVLTRRELEGKRLRILRDWPMLEQFIGPGCDCCISAEIWGTYGVEAANAWDELTDIRFLLGEDT